MSSDQKSIHSNRKLSTVQKFSLIERDSQRRPGPGSYHTEQSQLSHIGFKIGKDKRYKEDKSNSPGPGAYNIISANHIPSFKVGTESRIQKLMTSTIGPGAYNIPSLLRKNIGALILPRREQTVQLITPGPNAYKPLNQIITKSIHIGTSKRDSFSNKQMIPGPGEYSVQRIRNNIGYSMGRSQRIICKTETMPGPGQYEQNLSSNAPKYSIFQRPKSKAEIRGPGPQSYTIRDFKDTRSISFNQAKREILKNQYIPGPGEYETQKQFETKRTEKSIIFGREKRTFSHNDTSFIPGPGQYEITSKFLNCKKKQ